MSHTAHIVGDVSGRGLQIAGILVGAARQHAVHREARRLDGLNAVDSLAAELARVRRLAAASQAEVRRARQDLSVLGVELAAANARADKAERAFARLAAAVRQRLGRA